MSEKVVVEEFKEEHRYLSNFHKAPFVWSGIRWETAEHAYQAAKAAGAEKDEWIDRISQCKTPGEAKKLGRKVPLREKWELIKDEIMRRIVEQKFIQNPSLLRKLIATGEAELQEGNQWKDNYWGMCPPGNPEGRNQLGKTLMMVREQYRGQLEDLPGLARKNTFEQLEDVETEDTKQ